MGGYKYDSINITILECKCFISAFCNTWMQAINITILECKYSEQSVS